jgi:hypothetical protein
VGRRKIVVFVAEAIEKKDNKSGKITVKPHTIEWEIKII